LLGLRLVAVHQVEEPEPEHRGDPGHDRGEQRPEVHRVAQAGDELDEPGEHDEAQQARDQHELGADQRPGSAERPARPLHGEILRCPSYARAQAPPRIGPAVFPTGSMGKNRGTDAQLLTMHELAAYLHLDEATVTKLVMQGKIPSLQVDRQWRFKRTSIDEWIEQQLVGDDENFADVPDGMKLPLEDLVPDQAIITNLRARTPVGVIEELAARAYTNGWLSDKPWFVG